MNDQIELLSATEYDSKKDSKFDLDFSKIDFSGLSKLFFDGCENREYKIFTGTIPAGRIKGGLRYRRED